MLGWRDPVIAQSARGKGYIGLGEVRLSVSFAAPRITQAALSGPITQHASHKAQRTTRFRSHQPGARRTRNSRPTIEDDQGRLCGPRRRARATMGHRSSIIPPIPTHRQAVPGHPHWLGITAQPFRVLLVISDGLLNRRSLRERGFDYVGGSIGIKDSKDWRRCQKDGAEAPLT